MDNNQKLELCMFHWLKYFLHQWNKHQML